MNFIYYLIYFSPFLLFVLIILLISNLKAVKQRVSKLNFFLAGAALFITILLVFYYLPQRNILGEYNLNYIDIDQYHSFNNTTHIMIEDKDKINKILEVINNHTYIRSAFRTVNLMPFTDSQLIILSTQNPKPQKVIHIYVLKNDIENNALQINSQIYNVTDSDGFSKDIYNVLKDLKLLDN